MPTNNKKDYDKLFDDTFDLDDDDFSSEFIDTKQNQEIDFAEENRRRYNPSYQPFTDSFKRAVNVYPKKVWGVAKDVTKGVAQESVTQVAGGVFDAGKELGKTITSLADSLNIPTVVRLTNKSGEIDVGLMTSDELKSSGGQFVADELSPKQPESTTGGLIRGVAQFLTGWIPLMKGLKSVGPTTKIANALKGMAAGAAIDFSMFDPFDKNLADLQQQFPVLDSIIPDFMESDPNNPEFVERFKKAVEGLTLGALTDGFFHAVKALRTVRIARKEARALKEEKELIDRLSEFPGEGPKAATELTGEELDKMLRPDKDKPKYGYDREYGMGDVKADSQRALNINIDRYENAEDIRDLIEKVAKDNAEAINEQRREVITNKQTLELAKDLGMSVVELLSWRKGKVLTAEEATAARQILSSASLTVIDLAKKAKLGSEYDLVRFRKALSLQRAIQLQVSGMTAEAGRLLQSFNIKAGSSREQERMISDLIEAGGGIIQTKKLAEMVSLLDTTKNPVANMNKFAKKISEATTFDMVYEAWINAMFTNPTSHFINFIGNSITLGWSLADRKVAQWVGRAIDEQSVAAGEVTAQYFGIIKGAELGFQAMWQALKSGEPTDILTKAEFTHAKSITAKNLHIYGPFAKFADLMGEAIRSPTRVLMASDELFKTIAYLGEVSAQAHRQAYGKGLRGNELSDAIADIISNPKKHKDIHLDAVDFSRYITFTKPLGGAGMGYMKILKHLPALRIVTPIVRTPINIMKYAGEHSILAPISKNVRAEIAEGGARRDMALAKIATGSMIMAVGADLFMSDVITDRGPADPNLFKAKWATGWRPHALHIGDTYVQFDRADPIGATLSIAADLASILGKVDDYSAMQISGAAIVAISQNVMSKTYLRNLSQAINALTRAVPDPEEPFKYATKFLEGLTGSLVPAGVAALERQVWPEMSVVDGYLDAMYARTPFLSKSLPPARNLFGDIVETGPGIGLENMSPFYISHDKKDIVADEIVRQQVSVRMPSKKVDGVELSPWEYDRYIVLYSGQDNPYVDRPLKVALQELINSWDYKTMTDGPDGMKALRIKSIIEHYRKQARTALKEQMLQVGEKIEIRKYEKRQKLGIE